MQALCSPSASRLQAFCLQWLWPCAQHESPHKRAQEVLTMSTEQSITTLLDALTDDLVLVESRNAELSSQDWMNTILQNPHYQTLRSYRRTLIPALHQLEPRVPSRALAPLIRSVVGKRFDVPDAVYTDVAATRAYATAWLAEHVDSYRT